MLVKGLGSCWRGLEFDRSWAASAELALGCESSEPHYGERSQTGKGQLKAPYNFADFTAADRVIDGDRVGGTGVGAAVAGISPIFILSSDCCAYTWQRETKRGMAQVRNTDFRSASDELFHTFPAMLRIIQPFWLLSCLPTVLSLLDGGFREEFILSFVFQSNTLSSPLNNQKQECTNLWRQPCLLSLIQPPL